MSNEAISKGHQQWLKQKQALEETQKLVADDIIQEHLEIIQKDSKKSSNVLYVWVCHKKQLNLDKVELHNQNKMELYDLGFDLGKQTKLLFASYFVFTRYDKQFIVYITIDNRFGAYAIDDLQNNLLGGITWDGDVNEQYALLERYGADILLSFLDGFQSGSMPKKPKIEKPRDTNLWLPS
jgi:hypothetical protein